MRDYGDNVFKGTAQYYANYRPHYPDQLFKDAVDNFGLVGKGNLLDLGCGTGELAIPLAPYFETVHAWDPDVDMLNTAKVKTNKSSVNNIIYENKSSKNLGSIDFPIRIVAMGQSFHWMDQETVLSRLFELVQRGGGVMIVGTEPAEQNEATTKKDEAVQRLIKKYLGNERRAGDKIYTLPPKRYEELLPNSKLHDFQAKTYTISLTRSIDELLGHLYSMSWASKALLKDQAEAFEQEAREALQNIELTGIFKDNIKFSLYMVSK